MGKLAGICLAILNDFGWFSVTASTSELLLFASLISAVDPVAVIAVFEEMHVNKPLFVTVFGEALFNDAISVVLFGIFKSFALTLTLTSPNSDSNSNLDPDSNSEAAFSKIDYLWGFVAFFAVSFGGVLIGILSAIGCALSTRY
uniref:Na_H_Exchanger domain-containing protein n=1 Tax=Caenorhabditis japonica TaxID=281687 RepID=A0A8R1EVY9_CAEJA